MDHSLDMDPEYVFIAFVPGWMQHAPANEVESVHQVLRQWFAGHTSAVENVDWRFITEGAILIVTISAADDALLFKMAHIGIFALQDREAVF